MSIRRTRRITAATAERLLAGAGGDRVDDQHHLLAAVLAASAGPARPAELTGLHQAVAGFQAAQLHPAPTLRSQSVIKTALVKLLTVKAAAVAVVVVGGGVALAASTGALPNPLSNHANPAASAGMGHASDRPSSDRGHSSADPSPSLVGLCHAYTAGNKADHGKALENPAFGALITTAGGKDKVEAYCTTLLAASASESAHPGGQPSDHPTGAPASHATGGPTGHPTGDPTDHPTGRPSQQPTSRPSH